MGQKLSETVVPITNQVGLTHPSIIPIDKILPNRKQPRLDFDEEGIKELCDSIKREGVLQPLIVSPIAEGRFELVAGERRLRAAKEAGLKEVPVLIRNVHESKMLELALVENIQREDLNPIEEAKGYQALMDQMNWTAADVSERIGKSREHVSNLVRLLKLPKLIQEDVSQNRMNAGHARALLSLPSIQDQLFFREKILEETLSVRDVERMVQEKGASLKKMRPRNKKNLSEQMKLLIDEIEKVLATKVRLQPRGEGKGQLIIEYYSWQDLDRFYKKIVS